MAKSLSSWALSLWILWIPSTAVGECSELLRRGDGVDRGRNSQTSELTAYLGDLLVHRAIGDRELRRLIKGLDRREIVNPITEEQTRVRAEAFVHGKGIQNHIDLHGGQMDRTELLDWSRKALAEEKRVRAQREATREETQSLHQRIEFRPIKGGRFQMGEEGKKVDVELTYDIEVMTTPVTQKQWAELMGENPSHFSEGKDSIIENVNGRPIRMRPDHPVETVSWYSALVFANKLSEKHGLKPVYDLKGIDWPREGRAEDGSLYSSDDGELLIDAATKGDFYRAEGFRLPTDAEQEYLLLAGGRATGRYAFGDRESDLKKYAWYHRNQTRPVGQLTPIIIDGQGFYDLHGNVKEWGQDRYGPLMGGKNPVTMGTDAKALDYRIIRGGCYLVSAGFTRSALRSTSNRRGNNIGFRLVRTIACP